jgi:glycosyltransferase involved in cell wall biosynthesis
MKLAIINRYLLFTIIIIHSFLYLAGSEKPYFVIVVPSFNNAKYYKKNIESLINQDYGYHSYEVIYIDDASTDQTGDLVVDYVNKFAPSEFNFKLITNKINMGAGYNRYMGVHLSANKAVILFVDGDDYLLDSGVLGYIGDIYKDLNIWLTYGQFIVTGDIHNGHQSKPKLVNEQTNFRIEPWQFWHLRTFRSALLKKIKLKDLLFEGKFMPVVSDLAESLPALEMAKGHIKCVDKYLYGYNLHSQSDAITSYLKQRNLENYCRALKPYNNLNVLNYDVNLNCDDYVLLNKQKPLCLNSDLKNIKQLFKALANTRAKCLILASPLDVSKTIDLSFMSQDFNIWACDQRYYKCTLDVFNNQEVIIKKSVINKMGTGLPEILLKQDVILFAQPKYN